MFIAGTECAAICKSLKGLSMYTMNEEKWPHQSAHQMQLWHNAVSVHDRD